MFWFCCAWKDQDLEGICMLNYNPMVEDCYYFCVWSTLCDAFFSAFLWLLSIFLSIDLSLFLLLFP